MKKRSIFVPFKTATARALMVLADTVSLATRRKRAGGP